QRLRRRPRRAVRALRSVRRRRLRAQRQHRGDRARRKHLARLAGRRYDAVALARRGWTPGHRGGPVEFRPIVRSIGEGRVLKARGSTMWFKALGSETTGMFSLMERELPPAGRRPSPHRHTNCHESFYVLDGEIEFLLDGKSTTGGPGTFVLVPAGV